jgi:hypothetical protein
MYTWNYHKETPCVAILNKMSFFKFIKSEKRRGEQVMSRELVSVGEGKR